MRSQHMLTFLLSVALIATLAGESAVAQGSAEQDGADWENDASSWSTIRYVDVNGDGKSDVCGRGRQGIFCSLSVGETLTGASLWSPSFADAAGWNRVDAYYQTIQFPDVNGDGKADVCGRGPAGVVCGLSTGEGFEPATLWSTHFNDNDGWSQPSAWQTLKFPDINGDGKADICGRFSQGVDCGLSNGRNFGSITRWGSFFTNNDGWTDSLKFQTFAYPDINGDGMADVCSRADTGINCALSTGRSFTYWRKWNSDFSNAAGWTISSYALTIRFPDLNGDGKADVCGRGGSGIHCSLSTGEIFAEYPAIVRTSYFSNSAGWASAPYYWRTISFQDLNHDGKDDVCGRGAFNIACVLSDGQNFTQPTPWTNDITDSGGWNMRPSFWMTIGYPDLNGDGYLDLCARAHAGIICGLADSQRFTSLELKDNFFSLAPVTAAPDSVAVPLRQAVAPMVPRAKRELKDKRSSRLDAAVSLVNSDVFFETGIELPIPDDARSVTHSFYVDDLAEIADLAIRVAGNHSFVGDLTIDLSHPDGTVVRLAAASELNRSALFDITFGGRDGVTVPELQALRGKSLAGTWTLRIKDTIRADEGDLQTIVLMANRVLR